MKPINEIRIKLIGLSCAIVLPLFSKYYPYGSGLTGLRNMGIVFGLGIVAGYFTTNFLTTFKKWWKEK